MAPVRIRRRTLLLGLGSGLAIGMFPSLGRAAQASELRPNVFVHIALDGTTTLVCARSEMGQGVRSTIPLLIADELGADPAKIVVQQGVGDKKYGDQNTDGSSSIRKFYDELRRSGAAARIMLTSAAAKRWKVDPQTCSAQNHRVTHLPSKRSLGFDELVADAAKLPVPRDIPLRPSHELIHTNVAFIPLLDGPAYVTGSAQFGADITLPGMRVAVIARPPDVGGTVRSYDAKRALAIPGVTHVIEMPAPKEPWKFQPWGGIAVVADNTWAAMKGRAALTIAWEPGPRASYDSARFRDELLASVRAPGTPLRQKGDVDAAFARASRTVEAEYVVPHLSHMQMEPLVALAEVRDGKAELWAPTQNPQDARKEVAELLGLSEDAVTVNVTLLGGGFGRKSKADFVAEAAFLAREVKAPVRVQWTREDDVQHGYYNAASAQRLRAALDDHGSVTAWHHRSALTPIANTLKGNIDTASPRDFQQGVLDFALAAPNVRAEACKAPAQVRVGWYRSVYNIFHSFAIGSFIDELAHARGSDPRDTWLDVIGPPKQHSLADLGIESLANYGDSLERHPVDAGRLRHVIERVTELAGWHDRKGRALGLAAHRSFLSYVAVVLSIAPDTLHIDEAYIVMDAGHVVNRDRAHAQLEGAVVMGISNALYGGITMKNGVTQQSNFRDARVARIGDVPRRIHSELVESSAPPAGVGEPGVPPVGAALANAIFAATGRRLREIPLARALADAR